MSKKSKTFFIALSISFFSTANSFALYECFSGRTSPCRPIPPSLPESLLNTAAEFRPHFEELLPLFGKSLQITHSVIGRLACVTDIDEDKIFYCIDCELGTACLLQAFLMIMGNLLRKELQSHHKIFPIELINMIASATGFRDKDDAESEDQYLRRLVFYLLGQAKLPLKQWFANIKHHLVPACLRNIATTITPKGRRSKQ